MCIPQVEAVQKHAPAITMEEFMGPGGQASEIWPEEERAAFCYSARQGKEEQSCNAKEGSPFGPFWDNFNINFNHSELYGPLHYDVHHGDTVQAWSKRFPPPRSLLVQIMIVYFCRSVDLTVFLLQVPSDCLHWSTSCIPRSATESSSPTVCCLAREVDKAGAHLAAGKPPPWTFCWSSPEKWRRLGASM